MNSIPVSARKDRRRDTPQSSPGRQSADAERKTRGSGVQSVYTRLKSDILDLSLPPGEALDEVRLSERFALSRTPIREALVRLGADGLVVSLPNRNTVVAPIDLTELPAFFDAFTLMYRMTTRLAASRRTEDDLARMREHQRLFAEAVERSSALDMISTNRALHMAIAHAGRNRYYTDLFSRLLDEGRRMLRIYYRTFGDRLPAPYVAEHDAMIAAIAAGDADLADRLGRDHAAQIVRQLQRFISADAAMSIDLGDGAAGAGKEQR